MMLAFKIVLSTLLMYSVKCDLLIQDLEYHQFSKNNFNVARMLSSMSPYNYTPYEEECQVARVWILLRHEQKYPSNDVMININEHLTKLIQPILQQLYSDPNSKNVTDLQPKQKSYITELLKWKDTLMGGTHKDLTERGKVNMMRLGMRLNAQMKHITSTLLNDEVEVLAAIEDRCINSARKFINTFFEDDSDDIDVQRNSHNDPRLKLVKPEPSLIKVEDITHPDPKNNLIFAEDLYFKLNCHKTTEYFKLLLFPDHIKDYIEYRKILTDDIVKSMYYACVYGYNFNNKQDNQIDPWCQIFRFEDLQMFEDMNDLQYYYKNGYYLNDNTKIGNPLVDDLLQFLKDPMGIKFKLFVGHTSNILSLITRFNLFNDKLTVENIQNMTKRRWRTSFLVPVGCNIIVTIYDCGFITNNYSTKVSIFINEVPLQMQLISNGHVTNCEKCPIDDVISLLNTFNTSERLQPKKTPKLKTTKSVKKVKLTEKQRIEQIVQLFEMRKHEDYKREEIYKDKIKHDPQKS